MKRETAGPRAGDRETVERLLDTAERLFGELGYDGVGMRMLAAEARVNLGAATYHFGSKEALFVATFMRRFKPIRAERLRLLDEAEAATGGKPLPVEKIIECMLRPPFESDVKHAHFRLFLARNLFMPPPFMHAAVEKEIKPEIARFAAAFRRALPGMAENLIQLRTMFAMGASLMFSVQAARISAMHSSKYNESLLRELLRFASAGMESPPADPSTQLPPLPPHAKPSPK